MKKKFLLKEFNFFTSVKEKQRKTTSFSWMLPILVLFTFLLGNKTVAQTVATTSSTGNYTWTAPCDVSSITVEVWGAGGGGAGASGNPAAGGGGSGGGYIKTVYTVTPGTTYNLYAGVGGIGGTTGTDGEVSWFNTNAIIKAIGGKGAGATISTNTYGSGAVAYTTGNLTSGTVAFTTYGGSGSNATSTYSGAGGSSAGSTIAGNGTTSTGGVAPTDGYGGANGITTAATNGSVGGIGAGGSGGRATTGAGKNGGEGGRGQVKITYTSTSLTYCIPGFGSGVEPITNVTFAGINNTTTNMLGGSSLENFCITGTVLQGSASNVISIKGNTAGNMPNNIRVYIDWDQNGTFGNVANEIYDLGTITNSTGIDAITLTGNIAVPAAATLGNTKMRVMKKFNAYPTGPCQTGAGYGQAEDYNLTVTALALPTITSLGSASGCVGTSIIINGTNLSSSSAVSIGGTAVASITSNTATQIVAVVGSGTTGTVTVTTTGGTAISAATFTVNPLPVITAQPVATSICTTGTTIFSVTATGATTYQWRRGGINLTNVAPYSNVGTATLTITNPALGDTGNFDVIVGTAAPCTITSSAVALTVTTVPSASITPSPANTATGVCYAGIGAITSISWAVTATVTSYDVYFGAGSLPGSVTSNVGTNSYTTGALLANTTYYWKVVAKNACGDAIGSSTWAFTTSSTICYCSPTYTTGSGTIDQIANVTLLTLNNSTGASANPYYTFYNAVTIPDLQQSATAAVSVTLGSDPNQYVGVWIDFNNDGTFQTTEGSVSGNAGANGTVVLNIPVPTGAVLGNTRMRVRGGNDTALTTAQACGASSSGFGETEDYIVNIIATSVCTTPTAQPTSLSLTPTGNTITGSFTLSSPATDKYLVVINTTGTPPSPVNTTTYTVGGTVSAGNTVVDIDNNNTFTATGLTPSTHYYIFVFSYNSVCTGGPLYYTTSPLNGSTTTLSGNYCTPTASSGIDGTGIINVSYSTVNYSSNNTTVYNSYTAQTGNVIQGASLPVSITTATSSFTYNLKIWVDWNNDFDFTDAGEDMYSGTVASTTISASISIPLAATVGNHRMRIGIVWVSATPSTPSSCYNGNWAAFEDYTLNITSAAACTLAPVVTGHPSNGTIANGGNTTFTATFSNSPTSYFWEVSTDGGINYTTMTNGGVYSGATTATLIITAAPGSMNGYKFRITASNACGTSAASNPATLTVTTTYCSPSSTTSTYYISGITSVGTLNDASNTATGYSAGGYGNYSTTTIATQIAGGGINININLEGPDSQFVRTYIDWNGDGDFVDSNEQVYTTGTIATGDTSYGFVVPVTATPGNYRMRIRTRGYIETSTIASCTTGYSTGETEDYTISIVADCSAKITSVTNGSSCGTGTTTLTAVGSGGATQFRWYANETGGVPLATTTVGSWTTPSLSSSTTYYVTVYNGSCESLVRMAVRAIINPTTNITFSPSAPIICGEESILTIIASGDTTVEDLFTENFEVGTLGGFTLSTTTNLYDTNSDDIADAPQPNAPWSIKTSTYQPTDTSVWRPAINSGSLGDKFAFTTSDYLYNTIETNISTGNINTANFTDLTLTFKHYYSYYGGDSGKVQVSIDGGTNWINVTTYSSDLGSASKFTDATIDLSAYVNVANFRFRYKYTATWDDGWAIDDVRLFGTKPLNTTFTWGGATVDAYIDLACTIPYVAQSITTVYVKPTAAQLINPSWSFTATATLSNGCPVSELITVTNKTKLWQGTTNDWNDPNNWLPTGIPTANDCVLVEPHPFPSTISTSSYQAYGKNLTVKSGGILNVLSDTNITITDFVDVRTGGTFNLKNNASLVQINNVANTGIMNMERITQPMYRYDYTYWGSPVTLASNFTLGNLSPGSSLRYTWIPSVGGVSGNWAGAGSGTGMIAAKGYIVRAPDTFSTNPSIKVPYTANFIGTPNNGDISIPITYGTMGAGATADKWNLISNPYPSAVNGNSFLSLVNNTSVIGGTIYFWTHNSPPAASSPDPFYGDFAINYTANDYASWNKLGGTATVALSGGPTPTGYIAAGAAFFVKSLAVAGNAIFTNSMRVTNNNNQFFRSTNPTIAVANNDFEKHRIWLNLTNNSGAFSQILVGYAQGATLGMDRDFDGTRFGGNGVTFYSILPEANLGIQGRPLPFNINDQVSLGYNAATAGSFSVRIDHIDGLFDTQNIYLEDHLLQVIHNLKLTPYVFTTTAGNFNNRFVLRYTESTLGTDAFDVSNTVKVTVHEKVTVHASNQLIKEIVVFDLLGRKIDTYKNIEDTQFILNHLYKTNNVLILKITLENDAVVTEKIIY